MIQVYRVDEIYQSEDGVSVYTKAFTTVQNAKEHFDRVVQTVINDYDLEERIKEEEENDERETVFPEATSFVYDGSVYDEGDCVEITIQKEFVDEPGENTGYGIQLEPDELKKLLKEEEEGRKKKDDQDNSKKAVWPNLQQ
jgi:hypothetical protein